MKGDKSAVAPSTKRAPKRDNIVQGFTKRERGFLIQEERDIVYGTTFA